MSIDDQNEDRIDAVFDEAAQAALGLSDKDARRELQESGRDPEAMADAVRDVLTSAVADFRRRALVAARREYESASESFADFTELLPDTPEDRLALLQKHMPADGSLAEATLQHRDFDELTDEDVISLLRQLKELGLIDEKG